MNVDDTGMDTKFVLPEYTTSLNTDCPIFSRAMRGDYSSTFSLSADGSNWKVVPTDKSSHRLVNFYVRITATGGKAREDMYTLDIGCS